MPNRVTQILICLLLLSGAAAAVPQPLPAVEYDLGGGLYQGLFAGQNFWDPYTRRFDRDETYSVTRGYADLTLKSGSSWSGFVSGAVDWIHDFKPEKNDDIDPVWIHAFVRFSGDRISADFGKQSFSIGRGLVFDYEEPGVYALWAPSDSHYIQLEAAHAFDSSPLVSVTAGYRPGFLERIEAFVISMQDEDNGFADLLNRQIGLDLFSGDGDLHWVGMAADLFFGEVYFSGIGMYQSGRMRANNSDGTQDFRISAWLFDAEANYNLTDTFSTGAFLFAASGDRHPGNQHFHAFVSPRPYNNRADIFFNGAVDGHDAFEGFSLAGIRWPGVIAPGVTLSARPRPEWLAEISAAALFPQADGSGYYGWETDLAITRTWGENNAFYLMIGFFEPGRTLEFPGGEKPDPIVSGTVGVNLWF